MEPGTSSFVGAWRGAPDSVGANQLGGYFTGLLDNLEVRSVEMTRTTTTAVLHNSKLYDLGREF